MVDKYSNLTNIIMSFPKPRPNRALIGVQYFPNPSYAPAETARANLAPAETVQACYATDLVHAPAETARANQAMLRRKPPEQNELCSGGNRPSKSSYAPGNRPSKTSYAPAETARAKRAILRRKLPEQIELCSGGNRPSKSSPGGNRPSLLCN